MHSLSAFLVYVAALLVLTPCFAEDARRPAFCWPQVSPQGVRRVSRTQGIAQSKVVAFQQRPHGRTVPSVHGRVIPRTSFRSQDPRLTADTASTRSQSPQMMIADDVAEIVPAASVPDVPKKKMLILISDTGGGHRASAQALQAALDQLYPNQIEIVIEDIWTEHSTWPFNRCVPMYQKAAKRPIFWRIMWMYATFLPTRYLTDKGTQLTSFNKFRRFMTQHQPDMVVSMHPLCQFLPLRVLRKMGGGARQVPFVTVVTDLGGAHPTWFHRDADLCFIPSNAVRKIASKRGLEDDQLRQYGLPVRPSFWQQPDDKVVVQQRLGLDPSKKTVLLMGGGDGVGKMGRILEALAKQLAKDCKDQVQVVVVCGKNAALKEQLGQKQYDGVDVILKGFITQMNEYMVAADCLVTKAGPGTIAEAAICGLPVMVSTYLPGQEKGNVPYVISNGFGAFNRRPKKIAREVSSWLRNPSLLESMTTRAKEAGAPQATFQIAQDLGDLISIQVQQSEAQHATEVS